MAVPQGVADLVEGQEHSETLDISAALVSGFTALTGDDAPVHTDAAFAQAKGFDGKIAHGFLVAAGFSRLLGTVLPGPNSVIHSASLDMRAPVHVGDRLTYRVTVQKLIPAAATVRLVCQAVNQHGVIVNQGTVLCVFRR